MGDKTLDLKQFMGGTSTWWKNPLFPDYTYTDGVKYVAEECEAYWLIDKIFATQAEPEMKRQVFQVWTLTATDGKGTITVEDGNDNTVATYPLEFTDFPLREITLWFTDYVLLLPTEY